MKAVIAASVALALADMLALGDGSALPSLVAADLDREDWSTACAALGVDPGCAPRWLIAAPTLH